jgi:putative transcriptional regulator
MRHVSSRLDICSCQASFTSTMKNAVRALRETRGLSQADLAEALGVSRQTINSSENDRYTPSLPLALAIGRFFDQRVEEVFDDDEAT